MRRLRRIAGVMLPTIITVYSDRSFTFVTKTPPTSYLLKNKLKLKSHLLISQVTKWLGLFKRIVEEIVKRKKPDLTADIEAGMRTVEGSARSMGLKA